MDHELTPNAEVERWLKTLGVQSLCQWDVLVFLHRHPTSLLGAEYIARLLGYADDPVVAALDGLESLGLVDRSRVSQNVRLYQFTVPPDVRGDALDRLLSLAGYRQGRLRLSTHLRELARNPGKGLEAARRFAEEAQVVVRAAVRRSRPEFEEKARTTWRRAI
jgi:hypothetical protein